MRIPPCHSRREIPGKLNLFYCAHPELGAHDQLVTPEICKMCKLRTAAPPEKFRPFPPPSGFITRDGPCQHLGEFLEYRTCPTCRGNVRLKVFACGHSQHVDTTLVGCGQCPDYRPVGSSVSG
jgi:hypothetical protein